MDEQDATKPKTTPEADSKPTADPAPAGQSPKIANGNSVSLEQPKQESVEEAAQAPRGASTDSRYEPREHSPARDSSSASISSVDPDMLGEIVVGTHHNGDRHRVSAERDDDEMVDAGEAPESSFSHYPKRKRSVVYADLGEDKMDAETGKHSEEPVPAKSTARHPLPKRQGTANTKDKGVVVGYWRDSPVPNDENKHAVIGFMDVRDRLRTRIQMQTVSGAAINARLFPIPPGPGGSWVTFERIVFSEHLVGHDHNVVKEYVKMRSVPGAEKKGELETVETAQAYLLKNPPPETAQPLQIAWGKDIPEHAQSTRDPQFKRRRTGEGFTAIGASPLPLTPQQQPVQLPQQAQQPIPTALTPQPQVQHQTPQQPQQVVQQQQQQAQIPTPPPRVSDNVGPAPPPIGGTRPTRILVGCWSKSDAPLDKDKHAVYGILGANDMFRVKLVRETMDGRFLEGNFPIGAGALWIAYEEVTFLPHLQGLTRPETKEYVRVRQAQLDAGETDAERISNETKAVYEAQTRVAANPKSTASQLIVPRHAAETIDQQMMDVGDSRAAEIRGSRVDQLSQHDSRRPRYSLPEADMRDMSRGTQDPHFERQRAIVDRAMTRLENNQERDDRYAASRAAISTPPLPNPERTQVFQDNVQRMQKVWVAQENGRGGSGGGIGRANPEDEPKIHAGVKYERRANGPFAGKLVSQGTIISIDGEDYVEYRVLTKPTFF